MKYGIINDKTELLVSCSKEELRDKLFFHMKFSLEIDYARCMVDN